MFTCCVPCAMVMSRLGQLIDCPNTVLVLVYQPRRGTDILICDNTAFLLSHNTQVSLSHSQCCCLLLLLLPAFHLLLSVKVLNREHVQTGKHSLGLIELNTRWKRTPKLYLPECVSLNLKLVYFVQFHSI